MVDFRRQMGAARSAPPAPATEDTGPELSTWATTYRPTTLRQFVGQPAVVTQVATAFERNKLPRTILITGPTGSGKTTLARIIAAQANGTAAWNTTSDVMEIDAGSDGGIETIRGLKDMAHHMPQFGRFRIYILDECHRLTGAAKSAALKLTEEPPARSMFIMLTNEPQELPQVLFDRGLHLSLQPCTPAALLPYLAWIARTENVFQPPEQFAPVFKWCAEASGGTPRKAVQLLQSASLLQGVGDPAKILEHVQQTYGPPAETVALQILVGLYMGDTQRIVTALQGRPDMHQVLRSLIYLNQAVIEQQNQALRYPPVLFQKFDAWAKKQSNVIPEPVRLFRIHTALATLLDAGYSTSAKGAFYLGKLGTLALEE